VAYSLARCQDLVPRVQRQIQAIFAASVVVLSIGAHAPLLSLDRPGFALTAKGYSYARMPFRYLYTHAPAGSVDREFLLEMVQRPFLSDILPKLSSDDQQELSRRIALLLAETAPLNGQAEEYARIERLVPLGFDRYFYYQLGGMAMVQHPNELPKAVAAVEFVRHRSAAAHYLALVGIYRSWPYVAALNSGPEAFATAPVHVIPELLPYYWRALGHLAGRYWYDADRSLSLLNGRVQAFLPRLDPSVQRYFLQGVGQLLFAYLSDSPWLSPAELEHVAHIYQEGLLEGWGMGLGELELFSRFPWKGDDSPFWMAGTKGFSARSLASIQRGKAQFEALFERPAPNALEPSPRP